MDYFRKNKMFFGNIPVYYSLYGEIGAKGPYIIFVRNEPQFFNRNGRNITEEVLSWAKESDIDILNMNDIEATMLSFFMSTFGQ